MNSFTCIFQGFAYIVSNFLWLSKILIATIFLATSQYLLLLLFCIQVCNCLTRKIIIFQYILVNGIELLIFHFCHLPDRHHRLHFPEISLSFYMSFMVRWCVVVFSSRCLVQFVFFSYALDSICVYLMMKDC